MLMQLVHKDVDLDGDHLVKKLLMLMLSTASSIMEMEMELLKHYNSKL